MKLVLDFWCIGTVTKCQSFKFDQKSTSKKYLEISILISETNNIFFLFFLRLIHHFHEIFCYVVKTPTYFIYHQFNKIINNPSTKSPPYKKLGRPLRFWECANVSTEFDFTQNLKKLETFNIVIEIGSKIIKFQHYVF